MPENIKNNNLLYDNFDEKMKVQEFKKSNLI